MKFTRREKKTLCSDYRGITLLSAPYKILSCVIHSRITPYSEEILNEYQCGFRKSKSTIDPLSTLWKIQEKCYEHIIDFKQTFDNFNRRKMLQSLGISYRLVEMVEVTLAGSKAVEECNRSSLKNLKYLLE